MIAMHLLLNLSLLLVGLFLFQLWNERKGVRLTKLSLTIYFTISLFICLALSSTISKEFVFDLRQIPLTLIGLFTGYIGSFSLLAITLLLRLLRGIDAGFWFTVATFMPLAIITSSLHTWFIKQTNSKKILISASISALVSLSWIITQLLYNQPVPFDIGISYTTIPIIGTVIICYTLHLVERHFSLMERIVLTEKMEAISQLSASISHEVRNPHTTIRGFLQLLKDPAFPPEKREEFIDISISELDRVDHIITDYLTFAKPHPEEITMIEMTELLKHIQNVFSPLAHMNNVEIITDFDASFSIKGDRNKLHQAIVNIMKNSIESMEIGGTLTIQTVSRVHTNSVIIQDTGEGMSREQVERLGEPYFSTKGANGTGLGMMVTYSIIQAMNGKIEVESQVQKGTSFRLVFPK